ncbi:ankyrin repeat domain-containing protein, partial [Luteolibacter marinus]|uniref:ankyrin repeat domain-containing protein n=1 Tax=Luteolibacter marinus TaxID=2776705 RepID=UPI001867E282
MNGKGVTLLAGGFVALAISGCKDREETARQELRESGYDLTPEAFFRAAESDDLTALGKLLENGIAVDTRNDAGDTALHVAAAAGMRKSADFLLDHHLAVDVRGADERTPLMAAVLQGTPAMVRYLLSQKADPLLKDAKGYRPLMLAVSEDRADMVAELAACDRKDLDVALLVASLEGKAAVIDELTKYGASIYARMDDGRTPLMLAAQNGNIEAVEMLLEIGANRFSMDDEGRIAADVAREAGHLELAMRLAEEPAEDEFGLEEPADLGAEMLAQVIGSADEKPEDAGGDSGAPSSRPAPGRDQVAAGTAQGEPAPPPSLDGAVLEVPAAAASSSGAEVAGAMEPPVAGDVSSPVVMRAFRQKELPLRVETVKEQVATIRMSGGGIEEVEEGAVIPGTPLKVLRVERRMRSSKDSNGG